MIEVTRVDYTRMLLNEEKIVTVEEQTQGCIIHANGPVFPLTVRESFDEMKKRIGLKITPRAETIALTR